MAGPLAPVILDLLLRVLLRYVLRIVRSHTRAYHVPPDNKNCVLKNSGSTLYVPAGRYIHDRITLGAQGYI